MTDKRQSIVRDFARWTALSALRSGAPIKSKHDVYPLLDGIAFAEVLHSAVPIDRTDFDAWHQGESERLARQHPQLVVGWATKLINVYLKTAAYVGDLGRPGLREVLHPPLDGGLWAGLRTQFRGQRDILDEICCVDRIRDIKRYATYQRIVNGCRHAAEKSGCTLFELEQYWRGSHTPE